MRTSCVKNGLVVAVILLLVGVAVQPAIAVNPNSIDSGENYHKNTMKIENSDCSIIAHIKGAGFIPSFINNWEYPESFYILVILCLFPFLFSLDSVIVIGDYIVPTGGSHYIEADYGYVYTDGKYGKQEIKGNLIGNLGKTDFFPPGQFEDGHWDYIGVEGFRGVITYSKFTGYKNFIGHAKRVGIEEHN